MSNRLPILQADARTAHLAERSHVAAAATHALAAGAALVEARSLIAHGSWLPWLKDTGIPERTAQRYMLLHRGGLESAIVADLGQEESARLAQLGLKLWPEPGQAFAVTDQSNDCGSLTIWHRLETGAVRYGRSEIFTNEPEKSSAGVYRPVHAIWLLALIHSHWATENAELREIEHFEAAAILTDWAGETA